MPARSDALMSNDLRGAFDGIAAAAQSLLQRQQGRVELLQLLLQHCREAGRVPGLQAAGESYAGRCGRRFR
ncbi:MAG: hypothetical protein R3F42_07595 [Pseudomonadota bacterium]